ncbi:MAG: hypothetical protein MR881_07885 [Bacteroidales bacterium]|nr:hypothetical protein [Bacteroidales bacterium]
MNTCYKLCNKNYFKDRKKIQAEREKLFRGNKNCLIGWRQRSRIISLPCAGPKPFIREWFGAQTVQRYLIRKQQVKQRNEGLNSFSGKKMRIGEWGFSQRRDHSIFIQKHQTFLLFSAFAAQQAAVSHKNIYLCI